MSKGLWYLLIQIFGQFILSKCTSGNTATSVSCETTKIARCLVIYWRNTFVSASSWDASKWLVSVSGLADSIWVASLKPSPAKIVLSTSICSIVARTTSVLFISGWDQVSHLAGRRMTWHLIILLTDCEPLFVSSCSTFDRGFVIPVSVDAIESTSDLQERPAKTISQISKHCCMLNLGIPMVKQTIPPSFFPVPLSNFWLWSGSLQLNFFFTHFTTEFPF